MNTIEYVKHDDKFYTAKYEAIEVTIVYKELGAYKDYGWTVRVYDSLLKQWHVRKGLASLDAAKAVVNELVFEQIPNMSTTNKYMQLFTKYQITSKIDIRSTLARKLFASTDNLIKSLMSKQIAKEIVENDNFIIKPLHNYLDFIETYSSEIYCVTPDDLHSIISHIVEDVTNKQHER